MTEVPPLPDEVRATMPPLVAAYVAALEAIVATVPVLSAQVAGLQERVAALEARLGQTSANSSRPPSSDPPGTRPASNPLPGGRRPGGQPGHRGTFRLLTPEVQVSEHVHHLPRGCGRCGMALPAAAGANDPPDWRHQVVDVRPVTVEVAEHHLAARTCGHCGQVTRAGWPAGVPQGVVGPHLVAMLALLTGRYRLSKREAAACLRDLVGVELAAGTVSAIEQQVSAALAPLVAEARAAVQAAPVVNMDETGWRQGRQRAWLWTVVAALVTVFHIDGSRGAAVAQTLLGPDWAGIVGSDRFSAYRWLAPTQRQVCWAHLKRDFQKLVDWGAGPRPVGIRLLAIHGELFEQWHRFRAGDMERSDLTPAIARLAAELRAVVTAGAATGHPVAQPLCRDLLTIWPALWTFVLVDGVEPTNNAAEQALRPAVLWRKGSFGTHSADGSRFVERMLTVTTTCRQQGRRVLDVLAAAIIAAQRGQPHPSLLPTTT